MEDFLKKILVPTDGSPESESAFAAIMPLVRAYAPEVALLYVREDPESPIAPPTRVIKACAALRSTNVNASLVLRDGLPAEEILRAAREQKPDLLAMVTHGRRGISRLLDGSVAEEVLRHAEVPILVTRPDTRVHDWKRLVVALDGSERGESILPEVVRVAKKLEAAVDVLQVAVPVVIGGVTETSIIMPPEDPLPYLNGVVAGLKAEGLEARPVALEGNPSREILRHLANSAASLLCMTTHGRSGLSRLVLGSVAEEVIRKAPCPILLERTASGDGEEEMAPENASTSP